MEILAVTEGATTDFTFPDFEVRLNTDTLLDIQIESTIRLPGDTSVSQSSAVSKTIVAPGDLRRASEEAAYDIVSAQRGDVIRVASPQAVTLSPGLYVETIEMIALDADYDLPIESREFRYLNVDEIGITWMSSTEYTELVLRTEEVLDRFGQPMLAYTGTGAGTLISPKEPTEPDPEFVNADETAIFRIL